MKPIYKLMLKPLPALEAIHTVVFDFDGVFTDNHLWIDQDGRESVRCDRADGLAMDLVRSYKRQGKLKAEFLIISKELNPVVLKRANKLKLNCQQGIADKVTFMRKYFAEQLPANPDPFSGLVFLGNDLNDLPLMRLAGYVVAPSDAHPLVCCAAHLVLDKKSGEGFVRSFIELLLGIDQLSQGELDELISNC